MLCSSLQSHAGLFNLCIVVLIAVNSRLIFENLMKVSGLLYGLVMTCFGRNVVIS